MTDKELIKIEERIKRRFAHDWNGSLIDAYIQGATEQKAIDIEKACEEFCRVCSFYDDCEKHCCPQFIKFKKAMEE